MKRAIVADAANKSRGLSLEEIGVFLEEVVRLGANSSAISVTANVGLRGQLKSIRAEINDASTSEA